MRQFYRFRVEIIETLFEKIVFESSLLLPYLFLDVLSLSWLIFRVLLHQIDQIASNHPSSTISIVCILPQSTDHASQLLPHSLDLPPNQLSECFETKCVKLLELWAFELFVEVSIEHEDCLFAINAIS